MKAPAADINIRDNYLAFHHKSIYECNILEKKLNRLANAKDETWKDLIQYRTELIKEFKIILHSDIDYVSIGEKLSKELKKIDNSNRRQLLILFIKYCSIIKNEIETKKAFELANKKKNLNFSEYRELVFVYYSKVHKFLLKGKSYRYLAGIGTIYINRTQVEKEGRKIDFQATKLKKKELQEKGIKLYNKYEAQEAKVLNLPYGGVDYRVWLRRPAIYSIKFIHSKFFNKEYDFTPVSYIHQKYRDYNYEQLAFEICKTNEDIYYLQIDLRTKINIYLKRNPERFVDFDRKITNQ